MGGEKKPLGDKLGCADGCGQHGCKERLEMGGEKKPLGMSELGCADGCGWRGCKGVGGNGCGEEAAAASLAEQTAADGVGAREWLEMGGEKEGNGRERKGQEGKGRERKGKKGKGRERKGKEGKERARKGKEGKGRERKGKEGKGRERKGEADLEISRRRMTVLK